MSVNSARYSALEVDAKSSFMVRKVLSAWASEITSKFLPRATDADTKFNKSTLPDKIEIKKFDPVVRKHVIYKEEKIT